MTLPTPSIVAGYNRLQCFNCNNTIWRTEQIGEKYRLCGACANGGDVGSMLVLRGYADAANGANVPMMAALDGLQRLFASDQPLVAWARGAGLAGVNALGPIRRRIARYAMGGA